MRMAFNFSPVALIIGYLLGCYFWPDIFSIHITETQWLNIWAWVWLIFWPIIIMFKFFWLILKITLAACVIGGAIYYLGKMMGFWKTY